MHFSIVISCVTHGLFRSALFNFQAVKDFLVLFFLFLSTDSYVDYSVSREQNVNNFN